MSSCQGKIRDASGYGGYRPCPGNLYKCPQCGATGCNKDGCSNQNVEGSNKCKKCGKWVTMTTA